MFVSVPLVVFAFSLELQNIRIVRKVFAMARTKQTARKSKKAKTTQESLPPMDLGMSEPTPVADASPAAEKPASPAKAANSNVTKRKKPKVPKSHPSINVMVFNAVETLKESGGSSLPDIKKFLAAEYKVDVEKLAPFIKKRLKSAVAKGQLVKTDATYKLPAQESHE